MIGRWDNNQFNKIQKEENVERFEKANCVVSVTFSTMKYLKYVLIGCLKDLTKFYMI